MVIHNMADKISEQLVIKKIVSRDDKEIYVYGTEVIISNLINIIIAIALGILFNYIVEMTLFLLFFTFLRSYAGGVHANSYNTCIGSFFVIALVFQIISKIIPPSSISVVSIIISLISLCVVFIFSPVADPNKPLYPKEYKKYRVIARIIVLFESIAIVGTSVLEMKEIINWGSYIFSGAMGMSVVAILIIVAKIIKKEAINYDKDI